jgi:hypothetical protein
MIGPLRVPGKLTGVVTVGGGTYHLGRTKGRSALSIEGACLQKIVEIYWRGDWVVVVTEVTSKGDSEDRYYMRKHIPPNRI